jgi:hypothetical protein
MASKATAASAATSTAQSDTTTPEATAVTVGDGTLANDTLDGFPAAQTASDGPRWGNWRYTGPPGRMYTAVPVTPEPGDIVTHCGAPAADGCWEPSDAEATRRPDNWRPDLPERVTEQGGEG